MRIIFFGAIKLNENIFSVFSKHRVGLARRSKRQPKPTNDYVEKCKPVFLITEHCRIVLETAAKFSYQKLPAHMTAAVLLIINNACP